MEPTAWISLDYFKDYYRETEQSIISTLYYVNIPSSLEEFEDGELRGYLARVEKNYRCVE